MDSYEIRLSFFVLPSDRKQCHLRPDRAYTVSFHVIPRESIIYCQEEVQHKVFLIHKGKIEEFSRTLPSKVTSLISILI